MSKYIALMPLILLLLSCVSSKKYQAAVSERNTLDSLYQNCRQDRANLQENVKMLQQDTAELWIDLKTVLEDYNTLQTQSQEREEYLEQELMETKEELEAYIIFLNENEEKVDELQRLLYQKDSLTHVILDKVQAALMQFGEEDLTVEMKEGKVYISLSEQLLFKSGSYQVQHDGRKALVSLAEVLKKNPEIQVMIEGHTDSLPVNTGCIADNWDLSVLRATSVVRILTKDQGIAGVRLVACGKGPYKPVHSNNTKAGRQQNRRTEIILTPRLDELFSLLSGETLKQ